MLVSGEAVLGGFAVVKGPRNNKGIKRYPKATELSVTADAGGSNGYRSSPTSSCVASTSKDILSTATGTNLATAIPAAVNRPLIHSGALRGDAAVQVVTVKAENQ